MARIDFETKTDRELLILIAQRANDNYEHLIQLNDKLLKHEQRIIRLETNVCCNASELKYSNGLKSKLKDNWQVLSLVISVITLAVIELVQRLA